MARLNRHNVVKGQIYCVEWPEWYVECAGGCGELVSVDTTGECTTLHEAEKRVNDERQGNMNGWVKRGGLWYCPAHVAMKYPRRPARRE